MKAKKTYYKVVRRNDVGMFVSVTTNNTSMELSYSVNYWTRPRIDGSKIFVFADLERAKAFNMVNGSAGNTHIFECEVKGRVTVAKLMCYDWSTENSVNEFWKMRDKSKFKEIVPIGTRFANAVKLIAEIV